MSKHTYILKIGGSIATYKNRAGFSVRRTLLKKIALQLKSASEKHNFNLILLHGAGSFGHRIAKQYDLKNGIKSDKKKLAGAIACRVANQKLNTIISEIFINAGLNVAPVHTSSVIMQDNGKICNFKTEPIMEALKNDCMPLLYGDMVFDKSIGMSVCSGDVIAPYLAREYEVEKIFFATDVDGVFDKDPYCNKDAKLIEEINFDEVEPNVKLSHSHNVDVTGGLWGKISSLETLQTSSVKSVEIFNGFKLENFKNAFSGKFFKHTEIFFK